MATNLCGEVLVRAKRWLTLVLRASIEIELLLINPNMVRTSPVSDLLKRTPPPPRSFLAADTDMTSPSHPESFMDSFCSKKRAREESAQPQRHDQLWFDDGNIVLLVDNVAFRVHRSLLGRHSTVFKDLFELSQPSTSIDEQMDGVPLVKLHDSPHELTDLLDVIYNGAR